MQELKLQDFSENTTYHIANEKGQIPQMPQQVQCNNPIHPKKKISPITPRATRSQKKLGQLQP